MVTLDNLRTQLTSPIIMVKSMVPHYSPTCQGLFPEDVHMTVMLLNIRFKMKDQDLCVNVNLLEKDVATIQSQTREWKDIFPPDHRTMNNTRGKYLAAPARNLSASNSTASALLVDQPVVVDVAALSVGTPLCTLLSGMPLYDLYSLVTPPLLMPNSDR